MFPCHKTAFRDLHELNFDRNLLPAHSNEYAKEVTGYVGYDSVKDRGLTSLGAHSTGVPQRSKCSYMRRNEQKM